MLASLANWPNLSQKHTVWFGIIHHNLNGCHENWIAARRLTARSHYFTVCSISTASSYGNYVIRGRERTRILWSWIYDNKGLFIKKNNWIIRRVSKNCCNFWDFGLEDCSTISCVNRRKTVRKKPSGMILMEICLYYCAIVI